MRAASLPRSIDAQLICEGATPQTSAQPEYATLTQPPNVSLSSPASASMNGDHVHIRYPIVHSSITLIFTELGSPNIPIATVNEFFSAVLNDIEPSVRATPNHIITPHLWFFKLRNRRGGATISIHIDTRQRLSISWLQLQKLLKGLEVWMQSQRRPLVFDIDLDGHGLVAEGLVCYSAPRSGDENPISKRAVIAGERLQLPNLSQDPGNASFPAPVSSKPLTSFYYHVPNVPVVFEIIFDGPPVPRIYVSAALTTVLRRIAPNVSRDPETPIPGNYYEYRDMIINVTFMYLGYSAMHQLTWKQLVWVFAGLLGFIDQSEDNCRRMLIEVYIEEGPRLEERNVGRVILWRTGPEPGVTEET